MVKFAIAVVAATFAMMVAREMSARRRMIDACPSGTAVRVTERVYAEMEREAVGRVCVRVARAIREVAR